MQPELNPNQRSRENTLAVSLVLIVSGMILFFLYIISFGIVGNVLAGGLILVIVGSLHYLVWGHAMSAEVTAEREALLRQDTAAAMKPSAAIQEMNSRPIAIPEPPRATAPSDAIQDLSQTKGITEPR